MPGNKESPYPKDWIGKGKGEEIEQALRKSEELVNRIDAEVE